MYDYRKLTDEQKQELIASRKARGFPIHSPPHFQVDQAIYLLTAACYEHRNHMTAPERRAELLDRLFDETINAGLSIHAWVILPNHYHILAYAEDFHKLSNVFGRAHGSTAFAWNGADGKRGRRVWFRFSDRMIRSEAHYLTTLNYIHYNPVKHGWAGSPYDWVESSVHWYLANYDREWLRDLWARYPLKAYGTSWDGDFDID